MTRRQSGFTLLEMLVAVTVLSVLAALVYGMLRIGVRSWEAGSERIAASDLTRIGWQYVHASLTAAVSPPSLLPDDPGIHFLGAAESLEFVSELPAWLGGGGYHVLSLALTEEPGARERRLELEARPLAGYDDADLDPAGLPRAVLADDVERLAFAYFGVGERGGEPDWLDSWAGRESLPLLVRMEVELADGSAWPLLVAHPRLGQDRQFVAVEDDAVFDPDEPPVDDREDLPPQESDGAP